MIVRIEMTVWDGPPGMSEQRLYSRTVDWQAIPQQGEDIEVSVNGWTEQVDRVTWRAWGNKIPTTMPPYRPGEPLWDVHIRLNEVSLSAEADHERRSLHDHLQHDGWEYR